MAARIAGGKHRRPSLVVTGREGPVHGRVSIPLTPKTKTGRKRETNWGWSIKLLK